MTTYAEFRLRIEQGPTPNTYRVESSGLGGEMSATFELPFSDAELENIILKLGRTRRGVRKIESPETEIARAFGGRLFKTVMAGGIGETYRAAHSEANRRAEGLRVTLSLTSAPKLATIPWEFLFDEPDFLATSPETPIVRFLEVARPHRPIEISLPLRILVVICSPKGAEQLNTGLERANLEPALKPLIDLDAVKIDWLEHATLGSLNTQLRSESYHILHFIGHGGFDETRGEGALLFEDESGHGAIVGADRLAGILRSRASIRLVVLNSCEGARSSIDDPFSGVAASLIEREIPGRHRDAVRDQRPSGDPVREGVLHGPRRGGSSRQGGRRVAPRDVRGPGRRRVGHARPVHARGRWAPVLDRERGPDRARGAGACRGG